MGVKQRQHQDHAERHGQHAGHRGDRAAQAEMAVADHQGEVDHIRPRQHLGHRPVFQEFVGREPALLLDHLALHDGEHPAEALQREPREGKEQVANGTGLRTVGLRREGRSRLHRARLWSQHGPAAALEWR
jgi:hypothetical protein